jgi:hypothetical protein
MKALSEQLTGLAARSKKTEDVVAAAPEKNRSRLESQRDQLKTSIADGNAAALERAAAAETKTQQWWSDTRSAADARFATMRAEADLRRTERDIKKAEYTIIDAVIARAEADDLALNG